MDLYNLTPCCFSFSLLFVVKSWILLLDGRTDIYINIAVQEYTVYY
jgi:hypothetical protein